MSIITDPHYKLHRTKGGAANLSQPRVLVVGDAVAPTGFARVTESILERLCSKYEFFHLGLNYKGDPHDLKWKVYPAGLNGDPYGMNRLEELIRKIHPHLIFLIGDLWTLMQYAGILARLSDRPPTVAYFPVESDPVEPRTMVYLLPAIDHLVTYTHFGEREIQQAINIACALKPDVPTRRLSVIGHGVDRQVFFPLLGSNQLTESRLAARKILFSNRPDLHDAFIILNANRNQPRKRIDTTMEAFALFSKDKPENVKLYLHMARQDQGWDIQCLADRFNIRERLIVTREDNELCDLSPALLNQVYNACDVGINTSSSEGWGLVSFEHAATGAAQIVPRHTALTELWEDAAEFVEPSFSVISEQILTRAYFTSPQDIASAMQHLYEDPNHRQHLSLVAFQRACEPRMDWSNLAIQWDQIFSSQLRQLTHQPVSG
ncbi:glycosyltransferase family 4 protein [Microcystis aeruginosa CS-564/01]|uniref:glycosyltransferase family 4 protein n=1 Tax=Microcystis aeruginosa TaxID=1126 RepID=UPI00232B6720|nr:glycosyltransferase family 4 protein [Microcystis aeruginosa]MDB9424101.1 glycosyltransferase family 4 protein [Microcystis aeruginosa CS-564/01]